MTFSISKIKIKYKKKTDFQLKYSSHDSINVDFDGEHFSMSLLPMPPPRYAAIVNIHNVYMYVYVKSRLFRF